MNKKFLATSLMAATLFGASFTATSADEQVSTKRLRVNQILTFK
ncbi:hypothetical protein QUF56_07525 [Ureibacillus composti]|nr:hypothetical protein [Ureibacillus composti]